MATQLRAGDPAETTPLNRIDVTDPTLYVNDTWRPWFARLRAEAPVHFCADSPFGAYWSVSNHADIMAVEARPDIFSSSHTFGGITVVDLMGEFNLPQFIAMDRPKHGEQRRVVTPSFGPSEIVKMQASVRQRTAELLDTLPFGEEFDWVDKVSIELTTQMLAILFDFPWEDRRKLTRWSDVATAMPGKGIIETEEEGRAELLECLGYFTRLWNERVNAEPAGDLISMLAHGEATRNMDPMEYLGNIILLIVGGNDTTRNSITGGLLALNQNPDQYDKLMANPELIPSMVSEIIRWQTPLAYMRRTALEDVELGGKTIRKGDKVIMWYVSGNRDETVIENPDAFIIDRERPRHHLSFGFGIHRCVGNRLAEMQLRIVWEEILKRFPRINVVSEPSRVYSSFVKGYDHMRVVIPAKY
jgi:cytochrome P450